MNYGLQKLTLLDYPGKVACTIFIPGCNLRCPFCHNSVLAENKENLNMTENSILDFLSGRTEILDGVAVTGGEPLLFNDIEHFLRRIHDLGYSIKLDTNGTFPERLENVIRQGLVQYVAMDIKNSPDKYSLTTGIKTDINKIKDSIRIIMSSEIDYEFRTTVVKEFHTNSDFEEIGRLVSGARKFTIQKFVDNGSTFVKDLHCPDEKDINDWIITLCKYVNNVTVK